jgi:hypothetical protein
VLEYGLPLLLENNSEVRQLHQAFQNSISADLRLTNFEKVFEMVIAMWVDGEIVLPMVESWTEFRARLDRGLSQCMSATGRGQQLAVFCSGGLLGVAMRRALHLSLQDTLRAAWLTGIESSRRVFWDNVFQWLRLHDLQSSLPPVGTGVTVLAVSASFAVRGNFSRRSGNSFLTLHPPACAHVLAMPTTTGITG